MARYSVASYCFLSAEEQVPQQTKHVDLHRGRGATLDYRLIKSTSSCPKPG